MPPTRSSDSLLPRNVGPGSQFSSRAAEIFLDEEGLDGSLWLDTENIVDVASDPLFFAENSDISFPPIVFDEASAAACDDTQSSLDPITEIYGLNARDLIDEFTSLQDSKCCAFTGTGPSNPDPQKPVPDTDTQKPKPDTDPSLGTSIEQQPQLIRAPAGCPLDYHYALCCAGPIAGINVMGCVFCECFLAPDCRTSPTLSFTHPGPILSHGILNMPARWPILLSQL